MPDPPGLLLLACQQAAADGGTTLLADGAQIIATLAEQYPAVLRARIVRFHQHGRPA